MGQLFDLTTGEVAVGDPTMGLAHYPLRLPAGAYRLTPLAFRRVDGIGTIPPGKRIRLDSPCAFALDASHLAAFESWYHRVGNECSYVVHALVARLPEFESAAGARVGFYWENEIAGRGWEGAYVLDPSGIKSAEPDARTDRGIGSD